jgi:serine/threonine protein kinase
MKRVDHHSIVKVFEIYRDQEKIHIVMELLEGKELFDFIFQRERLKESEAATIIKQLVQ